MSGEARAPYAVCGLAAQAQGLLRAVLERDLPHGAESFMSKIASATDRAVVYVSTPITTGPGYLDWLITHKDASASARSSARSNVIRANIAAVVPLVRAVPGVFTGAHVIDPTALDDVRGWEQADYHRFWSEVIVRFADRVVFADGWTCSVGCSVEFGVAALAGLPMYDARFAALSVDRGLDLLRSTIPHIVSAGDAAEMQEDVISAIMASEG